MLYKLGFITSIGVLGKASTSYIATIIEFVAINYKLIPKKYDVLFLY